MTPKIRAKNKKKKLLFLGTAVSEFEPDYDAYDEIWGVGSAFGAAHDDIKKITLGFEIHPVDQIAVIAQERKVDYNKFDCPMMIQDPEHVLSKQLFKKPVKFPLFDVLKYTKHMGAARLFTSTFCYMMVYAAMMGYKEIDFYKILLTNDGEYFLERPGVEYWIEWLGMHEDVKFNFPEDAEMCSNSILYGYQERPGIWKLRSRERFLWECMTRHFYETENLTGSLNRASGMLDMHAMMIKGDKKKIPTVVNQARATISDLGHKYRGARDKYFQFSGALQTVRYMQIRNM